MAEPASKPAPRKDFTRTRKTLAHPPRRVGGWYGALTLPVSAQSRFLRDLVAAGLEGGLVPADAFKFAREALEWVHGHALETKLDYSDQRTLRSFIKSSFKGGGIPAGIQAATRAIEAKRLMDEYLAKQREIEAEKARKGSDEP